MPGGKNKDHPEPDVQAQISVYAGCASRIKESVMNFMGVIVVLMVTLIAVLIAVLAIGAVTFEIKPVNGSWSVIFHTASCKEQIDYLEKNLKDRDEKITNLTADLNEEKKVRKEAEGNYSAANLDKERLQIELKMTKKHNRELNTEREKNRKVLDKFKNKDTEAKQQVMARKEAELQMVKKQLETIKETLTHYSQNDSVKNDDPECKGTICSMVSLLMNSASVALGFFK